MTSLLARIKALEESQQIKVAQHIAINDYCIDYLCAEEPKPYKPSKTCSLFHADASPVRCILGPYGSGKSTACCAEVVNFACNMPRCTDGIRRCRAVFIRNTYGELQSTTLKTWQAWNDDLGHVKSLTKPPYMFHTFNDGNGIVELEILFLALDKPDDIKKLKSAEYSIAYLNEACELPEAVLLHIKGRVGRYPSKNMLTAPFKGHIIMDTNPPDTDHWLYKIFEEERPDGFKIFKQPPGLIKNQEGQWITNPNADNIQHLNEADYYVKQTYGASEEFIKVYCLGQYGAVISGKPVYPEYNDDMHSIDEIKPIEGLPLLLGWDFGLTPACIISQQDAKGRVYDILELVSEDMDLDSFVTDVVKPTLAREFPGFEIALSEGDPAGAKRADSDGTDCLSILEDHGIKTEAADTNDPAVRQRAVRYFLNRMIEGIPAYQLSRKGCPTLRKGFIGGYQFKRLQVGGEARFKDAPDKNKFSHIHDAKQYQALKIKGDDIKSAKKPVNSKQFINQMTAWG